MAPLRVAVLAPIAWRVPPRHYGPWEQFASLLTEGLVAAGVDVTLFATADSRDRRPGSSSVVAAGVVGGPDVEPKVAECLHIARVFERAGEFDLIHNSFDFLPLTYSGLVVHAGADHDPRLLVGARSCRSTSSTTGTAPTSPSATPTGTPASTTRPRSTTASTPTRSRCTPAPGGYLLFFGRIHPDKGTAEAIEVAAGVGLPLVIAGIVQDQGYFDERVAPHIDGDRVRYIGAGRARRARRSARRRARAAAPHRLRRAVRLQRGGGDGLRHAGRRLPARLDARADRRRPTGLPRRRRGRRRSPPSTGRRRSTGRRSARTAVARFGARPDGRRVPRGLRKVLR